MSKIKDANELVDLAFNEGFEVFGKAIKAERYLQKILDTMDLGSGTIDTTGRPYDHPSKVRVTADIGECEGMGGMGPEGDYIETSDEEGFEGEFGQGPEHPDNPDELENDIDHVPNQNADALYQSIRKQLGEWKCLNEDAKERYRAYFQKILKQYGVNSPSQLPADKKRDFFNRVDKGWQSKKESGIGEGLQGPGGKFGFEGEDGYKGYMGSDSNADEM